MPDIDGRDYDDIRMQSCAECDCDLLGMSEAAWLLDLPTADRALLPPLTFVHVAGRPYCESCRTEDRAVYVGRDEYEPYRTWGTGS